MTTNEHLAKIVARCRVNLALAENRTQGKWEDDGTGSLWTPWEKASPEGYEGAHISLGKYDPGDIAYIAACAGAAEAGWRATIAAIETAQLLDSVNSDITNAIADAIIAAWPEELL